MYSDSEIIETIQANIFVFYTHLGVFASHNGKTYAFQKYIDYLDEIGKISAAEKKAAIKSISQMQHSFIAETDEEIATMTKHLLNSQHEVQYKYNNLQNENLSTANTVTRTSEKSSTDDKFNLSRYSELCSLNAPSITVTRNILALNSGDTLSVVGYVHTSTVFGESYPASNIKVEIIDEDVQFDDVKATVYTDLNGYFSATFDNENNIFEKGCDIYLKINLSTDYYIIQDDIDDSVFENGYYITTDTITKNIQTSQYGITDVGFDNTEPKYSSISINQALNVGCQYFRAMKGYVSHSVDVISCQ